jgi:DUF1680 family protein
VVLVNGNEVLRSNTAGHYIELARVWRDGDRVELRLAMHLGIDRAPAAPDIVALTYGPLVLAGALGREHLEPGSDLVVNERKYGDYNDAAFAPPTLAGNPETLPQTIRATAKPLEFTIPAADQQPLRLVPYYRIAHERYATYWKLGSNDNQPV